MQHLQSPLKVAIDNDNNSIDILRLLLDRGADPNTVHEVSKGYHGN